MTLGTLFRIPVFFRYNYDILFKINLSESNVHTKEGWPVVDSIIMVCSGFDFQ